MATLCCIKLDTATDPCMGSGHILVYAFDVLMQIYESQGYTQRDAAQSILQNNLYGLDIDERAAQLAYFAVMMKARQYDRRIFSRGIKPHVYAVEESNDLSDQWLMVSDQMRELFDCMKDAKEYGSVLNVPQLDYDKLKRIVTSDWLVFDEYGISTVESRELYLQRNKVENLIDVAWALSQKYHVVVTNPPYMGASNMNPKLNDFIKSNYADYKSDFFSAFIAHSKEMTLKDGYLGFFTPYVWMFIQSYEKLRNLLYTEATIETLIQFEYSAFEEATVPVCTFAFKNSHVAGKKGCYFRLTDFRGGMEVQRQKTLEAIENHNCGYYFEQTSDNFAKIPGSPVAYWVSEAVFSAYDKGILLGDISTVSEGIKTGDNNRFLRLWYEINANKFSFALSDSGYKWYPHHKGGEFRKWYGNRDWVVNWENDGQEIKESQNSGLQGKTMYFGSFSSWSKISSKGNPMRYFSEHCLFDSGAPAISNNKILLTMALFNTKVGAYL